MSKRLVVTEKDNKKVAVLFENNKECRIDIYESEDVLDNIYVGRVKDVVQNIHAAFVEYLPGIIGYYSLEEKNTPLFFNKKNNQKVNQGDLILVQVKKSAVKTKAAVLTGNIGLTGKYVAFNHDGMGIVGVSKKITNNTRINQLKDLLKDFLYDGNSFVIRTDAEETEDKVIIQEAKMLLNEYQEIVNKASMRTAFSLIKESVPTYLKDIYGYRLTEEDEIVTDSIDIYDHLKECLICPIRLYSDSMLELKKLYSIDSIIESALHKKVWLKSGGYLIIEPTEALTVIDVNTGKYTGNQKDREKTFLKINMEAAIEIANQMILRNLSGIILVDFISMKQPESRQEIESLIKNLLREDPVKAVFVDFTKLDLVEITRKKIKKPLHELV